MTILFVCTGNACRSPFAEQLFQRLAPPGVTAVSAGTHAAAGGTASWLSIVAARAHGLDLGVHRRQPLDAAMLAGADRIYGFDRSHITYIAEHHPEAAPRAALLGEIPGGPGGEIPDPMGGSQEDVDLCYRMIDHACRALVVDLARLGPG